MRVRGPRTPGWADREVADCDLGLGGVHLSLRSFAEAESEFASARATYVRLGVDREVASCDRAWGILYVQERRFVQAEAAYVSARAAYGALGLWFGAAQIDTDRAELRLVQRDITQARSQPGFVELTREALGLLVPAVLVLDDARFQFTLPADRRAWARQHVASGLATALGLARDVQDEDLVADLIVTAKSTGRLNLDVAPELDGPLPADRADVLPGHRVALVPEAGVVADPVGPGGGAGSTLSGALPGVASTPARIPLRAGAWSGCPTVASRWPNTTPAPT